MKIEPVGSPGGKLVVTLKEDHGGFPGHTLETLSVARLDHTNSAGWLVINSRKQPELADGAKYWLCAKSSGTWLWHFSRPDLFQVGMYSPRQGVWASAGYTNVCSFSVLTGRIPSSPQ